MLAGRGRAPSRQATAADLDVEELLQCPAALPAPMGASLVSRAARRFQRTSRCQRPTARRSYGGGLGGRQAAMQTSDDRRARACSSTLKLVDGWRIPDRSPGHPGHLGASELMSLIKHA